MPTEIAATLSRIGSLVIALFLSMLILPLVSADLITPGFHSIPIVNNITNNIVSQMIYKTGYDKPIYKSHITSIVQQTPGVDYCIILKPEHDIFFNYNIYKDFTQEQLVRYSPQLVQIIKEKITVVVRNNK